MHELPDCSIDAYIFDCEITVDGFERHPGCLAWHSDFVEGGTRINMLRYKKHLMFIKDIKTVFKQWQYGECRCCFKHVRCLDKHVKTCNSNEINHVWSGGVFEPKKI